MYQSPPTTQKRRHAGTPGTSPINSAIKRAKQALCTPVTAQSASLQAGTTRSLPMPPSVSFESVNATSRHAQGMPIMTTLQEAVPSRHSPPLLLSASNNPLSRLSPSSGSSDLILLPAISLDAKLDLLNINPINPTVRSTAAALPIDHTVLLATESEAIFQQAQAIRIRATEKRQENSETGATYRRHCTRYERWWEEDNARQMREGTRLTSVPAHPITAGKVTLFLEHEMSREKVRKNI